MSLLARQVHCLSATTPLKTGKPPWCYPRQAEFWKLCCTSWCAAYIMDIGLPSRSRLAVNDSLWRLGRRLVRLPGLALGHSPWRGDILLLNYSRKIIRAGSNHAPGPLPFQQRTNTSCYLAIPTHGFTVVLSVFWGTPPAKPLKWKSVSNRLGARLRQRWTEPTGGKPRLSCAWIRLVLSDIIKTSFSFFSQCSVFRHRVWFLFWFCMGKQKTLLPFR
jgi:hypothetical protein